jgi:hypothetical protein
MRLKGRKQAAWWKPRGGSHFGVNKPTMGHNKALSARPYRLFVVVVFRPPPPPAFFYGPFKQGACLAWSSGLTKGLNGTYSSHHLTKSVKI